MRCRLRSFLALSAVLLGVPALAGPVPAVGQPAPSYTARTLDGRSVDLAALRGQVVLLKFWASWCEPCLDEMPTFLQLHQEFSGQGLQVVAPPASL